MKLKVGNGDMSSDVNIEKVKQSRKGERRAHRKKERRKKRRGART